MEGNQIGNKYANFSDYESTRRVFSIFSYIILCIRGCLGWIGIDTLALTLLLNLCIIISIDYKRVNKSFLLIPLFCILLFINKQILGVIDLIAMSLILKKEKFHVLVKIYAFILVCFIPIWLFLLYNGYIVSERWFDPNKGGAFFDYGFNNPNGLGIFGFNIISMVFLLSLHRNLWRSLIITLLVNQVFFVISSCRTAWIGGLVMALCILISMFHGFKNWMRYPLAILPPVIMIALIYLSTHCTNFIELDVLFSGRLSIYGSILNNMSILNWILGTKLPDGPMDGSYMMLFFIGGMIVALFYWILNFRLMISSFDRIKPYLPFVLSVMACGIMETTFSSCGGLSLLYWYLLLNLK